MKVETNKPLFEFCTFRIGGPAKYFVEVRSLEEVQDAIAFAQEHKEKYFVLGKGSNCLFDDRGYNGLVIYNRLNSIKYLGEGRISAESGASFAQLGMRASREKLGGLEFSIGIPGSVGGAIFMNAGASGRQVSDVVSHVEFLNQEKELKKLDREELRFSYRYSCFHTFWGFIYKVHFLLYPNKNAQKVQKEFIDYRMNTQPYDRPSAGCVFTNPTTISAGKLIQSLGLKGKQCGSAQISEKHANFIINKNGKATAADVLELIERIQEAVYKETGIRLNTEIRYVPF